MGDSKCQGLVIQDFNNLDLGLKILTKALEDKICKKNKTTAGKEEIMVEVENLIKAIKTKTV